MPSATARNFHFNDCRWATRIASCLGFLFLSVQTSILASLPQKHSQHPRFQDYPAGKPFAGKPPKIDLPPDYPQHEFFQLSIKDLVAGGVNFAGHYAVREWSCGTNCRWPVILDMKTGKFLRELPYGALSLTEEQFDTEAHDWLQFRADSRLLIVTGCFDVEGPKKPVECGTKYVKLEKGKFILIRFDSKPTPAHFE